MTQEEKIRYSRLTSIEAFGLDGLSHLRAGKALIIGCGALGSVCAMYLAASGIGKLAIADFDTVDLSNLQRQVFFSEPEIGKPKGQLLKKKLQELNSSIEIELYPFIITEAKAEEIFTEYDFIIDATDNPASKMMVDRVCARLSKPCCIGGVKGFSGQIMSWAPGHLRYSEVFPEVSCESGLLPCSISGVVGPLPGIIASMQALEAIKHLSGKGEMLYDKILSIDLFTLKFDLIHLV